MFGDLTAKGIEVTEHKVRAEMGRLVGVAHDQIVAESEA